MNQNSKWIIGIILTIVVLLIVFRVNLNLNSRFSILPEGQNNYNSNCSFITNIDPGESWDIEDYQISENKWVALDVDGTGMKTYLSNSFLSGGSNFCDEFVPDFNYLNLQTLGNFKMKYNPDYTMGSMDSNNTIVIQHYGPMIYICSDSVAKTYFLSNISVNLNCDSNNTNNDTNQTCTPNCIGKCGGVSDGCSGICNSTCQTTCTQEAKQCSDGSYVSRNSSINCDFNTCPTPDVTDFLNQAVFNIGTFTVTWLYLIIGGVIIFILIIFLK